MYTTQFSLQSKLHFKVTASQSITVLVLAVLKRPQGLRVCCLVLSALLLIPNHCKKVTGFMRENDLRATVSRASGGHKFKYFLELSLSNFSW